MLLSSGRSPSKNSSQNVKSLSRHLKHGEGGPRASLSVIRQFPDTSGTAGGPQPGPLSSPEALILGGLAEDKSLFAHSVLAKKIQRPLCVGGNLDSPPLPATAGLQSAGQSDQELH